MLRCTSGISSGSIKSCDRHSASRLRGSLPSTVTVPCVGNSTPDISCINVVLPTPFLPRRPTILPGSNDRSTPSRTFWLFRYPNLRFFISIILLCVTWLYYP